MHELRLHCSLFIVDVRLREFQVGGWRPRTRLTGPSLGWGIGMSPIGALWMALEPFDGIIEELLASLRDELTGALG